MTLRSTVLFPQAILPLYIFEERYRTMLNEVLAGDRIFAVASLDESRNDSPGMETPHKVAGIGIVRACKTNEDGTSNLILQGLARVEFESIVSESPFRRARIHQLCSQRDGPEDSLSLISEEILRIIETQIRLGAEIPREVVSFLANVQDPEAMLDLAISTLCASGELKQRLLETGNVAARHRLFVDYMRKLTAKIKLDQKLKGDLDEGDLYNN